MGGRVLTHHFVGAPELNCELGGEWIGNDHATMQALCKELELGLQKHEYANSFWNQLTPANLIPPGQWCMSAEALAIWEKFQTDFNDFGPKRLKELDSIDWWTQLKQLGFQPEDLLRRDMMDSTDFGETIRMNSAYTAATEYLNSPTQRRGRYRRNGFESPGREFSPGHGPGQKDRASKTFSPRRSSSPFARSISASTCKWRAPALRSSLTTAFAPSPRTA